MSNQRSSEPCITSQRQASQLAANLKNSLFLVLVMGLALASRDGLRLRFFLRRFVSLLLSFRFANGKLILLVVKLIELRGAVRVLFELFVLSFLSLIKLFDKL